MAFSLGTPPLSATPRFDLDAPLFWAFAALLVWAPIPLGSNRPWAWGFLEAAAFHVFLFLQLNLILAAEAVLRAC